jgi:hypothetical protein
MNSPTAEASCSGRVSGGQVVQPGQGLRVEHRWTARRYAAWVTDLLDHDLLGGP